MTLAKQIKALKKAQAKVALWQRRIQPELQRKLSSLPASFGFASTKEFVEAVKRAARGGLFKREPNQAAEPARKRRRRSTITASVRATVKRMAQEGKTGPAIEAALGISLATIQRIKKRLGLLRSQA